MDLWAPWASIMMGTCQMLDTSHMFSTCLGVTWQNSACSHSHSTKLHTHDGNQKDALLQTCGHTHTQTDRGSGSVLKGSAVLLPEGWKYGGHWVQEERHFA